MYFNGDMTAARTAAALALLGVLAAPAGAADADDNAEATIAGLQARGFSVTVNRIGTAPLSECVVTGVRETPQAMQILPQDPDDDVNVFQQPQPRTAIVSVNCLR